MSKKKEKKRINKLNKYVKSQQVCTSRELESDFKTRTQQARMEGVCGRTGNYANRVYYSESYTTPEQLFGAHVILNKLDAIYICMCVF